jgi:DNA-binding MarR family transcriptional regulator
VSSHSHVENLEIADRLHSAAIHLLRRLRAEDDATGLSAPRLSALSVIVFAGPVRISDLARAEQVRVPTTTRLVTDLERDGLVERVGAPDDARARLVRATAKGRRLLQKGRERRVKTLAKGLDALTERERSVLSRAAMLLERLTLPSGHPRGPGGGNRGTTP